MIPTRVRDRVYIACLVAIVVSPVVVDATGVSPEAMPASQHAELEAPRETLESASRSYDLGEAIAALELARDAAGSQPSRPAIELEVRASLLVAELERMSFENLDKSQRQDRSKTGARIVAFVELALKRLQELPDSSERWRLKADLLATKIRSDFRAKKFQKDFEEAVDRARHLDPSNAHVWVTTAKPLVFAGPKRGQDFDGAIRVLDRALEIEPGLESALLLRGLAEERRGALERAAADWRAALEANPRCEPARAGLERLAHISRDTGGQPR